MPVSQAQTGTARTSARRVAPLGRRRHSPSPTSRSRAASSAASGSSGADARLGGGLGDLAHDGVADGLAAGRLLERGGVELGDAVEIVLGRRERARGVAHRLARAPCRRRARSSAAASASTSCSSGATLIATSSGSSENQPTSETTSGLPSESARIDRARGLAHRRRAQRDDDVAGGHQRPEPLLVDVVLADDALGRARAPRREVSRCRRRAGARPGGARGAARTRRTAREAACSRSGGRSSRSADRLRRRPASTSGAGQAGCGIRQIGPS